MKVEQEYYLPFETFVFRTPCFPLPQNKAEHEKRLSDPVFAEAVFLASPEFYDEWQKAGTLASKEQLRLDISLYKYLSRAQTRCTPFGLFAGCSIGRWGDYTNFEFSWPEELQRCTRLDMNYLCAVIQYLEQQPGIQVALRYFPNDSIYPLGGDLRYVEYYFQKTRRIHRISRVADTCYLRAALTTARAGVTRQGLAESLAGDGITLDEALDFVDEMVEAQLLKSELEAAVTGDDPFSVLLQKLDDLGHTGEPFRKTLRRIQSLLHAIDSRPPGTTLPIYQEIITLVRELDIPFEPKYLFQTDLFKPTCKAELDRSLTENIIGLVVFLNRLNPRTRVETNLSRFKDAFYARYEEAEVPLLQVLDNELGLGYPVSEGDTGDINPLVDDLVLGGMGMPLPQTYTKTEMDDILRRKYADALRKGIRQIDMTDDDAPEGDVKWGDLPDTISVMCSVIGESVYIKGLGGASAGNLFGRFCHLTPALSRLTRDITRKEQELHPDKILAEIVHLPEARIGNILSRPVLREYEIPYLARPGVSTQWQIPLSDLMISMRNGRLLLRSASRDVEVIPRLTTAHNYSHNAMPVYRFLCELQSQEYRLGLGFQWGEWGNTFDWLPRVTYKNFILARQMWRISEKELKSLDTDNDRELLRRTSELFERRGIPRRCVVPDGDNELFVDMQDVLSLRAMLARIRRRPMVTLEEFLFDPERTDGVPAGYTNEFIIPFYRTTETVQA